MNTVLAILLLVATGPFFLLPSIFARVNRKRNIVLIVLLNVVLWIWLVTGLAGIFSDELRAFSITPRSRGRSGRCSA